MNETRRRGRPPGPSAKSRTLAADILQRLKAGEWPIGKQLPSYRQFAKTYKVGFKTMRLAFKALEAEGHVITNPRKPPLAALGAPLSSVLNSTIVLVMGWRIGALHQQSYLQSIWRGITLELDYSPLKDSSLLVLQAWNRWRHEYPSGLRDLPLPLKGILLVGAFPPYVLQQYETMNHPVVLLDQPGDKYRLHSVAVSNYEGAVDATSRLIAQGHRRIAFIRSLLQDQRIVDPDSVERQTGFIAACEKAGWNEAQFQVFTTGFGPNSAAVNELVNAKPRFTAILAASGSHADQAANAAKEAGLKIPRDLSIVAFRSAEDIASMDWSGPQTDFEEIGRKGIQILGRNHTDFACVRMPYVWHEGESMCPPK